MIAGSPVAAIYMVLWQQAEFLYQVADSARDY